MSPVSWLRDTLKRAHAHYQEHHHPPTLTAQGLAMSEHVSGHKVAKTVGVIADDRIFLLILPASRRVSLKDLREVLGVRKVRLLSENEFARKFPDCEVGSIPPFRHWPEVDLLMDKSLNLEREILFQGGTHTDTIQMPLQEWKRMATPKEHHFTVPGDWGNGGETSQDIEQAILEKEWGEGD